jgi:hypothetical protein
MLGITNTSLKEKFILFLCHQGCLPAYHFYRDHLSRQNDRGWQVRVSAVKVKIEKKFQISISDDPLERIKEKAKLLKLNKGVINLPMRALINPYNNQKLNEKLFAFSPSDTIKDYKYAISNNSLKRMDQNFTTADVNNIRASIIWLNWFMFNEDILKQPTRPNNVGLCLTQDALLINAHDGLEGLYKIARYNKRDLKRLFKSFPDDLNAQTSFLSAASTKLGESINHRMSETRINNLFRCYQYFSDAHSTVFKLRRMPNYYMYNPNILKTQRYLNVLFDLGYNRMQNLRFLHNKNKDIVRNKEIYGILAKNFSSFKA